MKKHSLLLSLLAIAATTAACNPASFTSVPETVSAGSTVQVEILGRAQGIQASEVPLHLCIALPTAWATPSFTAYRNDGADELEVTADAAVVVEVEGRHPVSGRGLSWRCFVSGPISRTGDEDGKVIADLEIPVDAQGIHSIFTYGMGKPAGNLRETGAVEVRLRVEEPVRDTFDHWSAPGWAAEAEVEHLQYDGTRFIAAADTELLISEDGVRWETISRPDQIRGLAFGNDQWVLLEGDSLHSLDFPEGSAAEIQPLGGPGLDLRQLVFGAGRFVATGAEGVLMTSGDGTSWEVGDLGHWNSVVALGASESAIVAFTSDRVMRSFDGVTWESVQAGFPVISSLAKGNGRWIAVGSNHIYEGTADGGSWSEIPFPTTAYELRRVGFQDGRFLLAASTGVLAGSGSSGWVELATGFSGSLGLSSSQSNEVVVLGGDAGFIATAQRREASGPMIQTKTLPLADISELYETAINVYSGEGLVNLQIIEGELPAGLSLSGGWLIGTPTETGTFPFTVAAVDEAGARDEQALSLEVVAGAPRLPESIPPARAGELTIHRLPIVGAPPFSGSSVDSDVVTISIDGSELVFEISLPTADSTTSVMVFIDDVNGRTRSASYTLYAEEAPTILPSNSDRAVEDRRFMRTYQTDGASASSWSVEGQLPPGMSVLAGSDLILEGAAAGPAGIYDFTVRVVDEAGWTAELDDSIEVIGKLSLSHDRLPPASPDVDYEFVLEFIDGLGPYTFIVTDSELPAGFEWTENDDHRSWTLAGKTSERGTYSQTIQVRDSLHHTVELEMPLVVADPPEFTTSRSLPSAKVGEEYAVEIEVRRGAKPYTFRHEGRLPEGIALERLEGGHGLVGTPTEAGQFAFQVRVEDANGFDVGRRFTLVVEEADEPSEPEPKDPTEPEPTEPEPSRPAKKKKSSGGCAASGGGGSLTPLAALVGGLALLRRRR